MKTILISIISLFFCDVVNAQQAHTAFIYENVTEMSKDSILKAVQLNLNDTTYQIKEFTYVISVPDSKPIWGINLGDKFTQEFITALSNITRSYGTLHIMDIFVQKKDLEDSKRKLAQQLKIDFRKTKSTNFQSTNK